MMALPAATEGPILETHLLDSLVVAPSLLRKKGLT